MKAVTRSNGTAVFQQTAYRFSPVFFYFATAVLQNGIRNFFFIPTVNDIKVRMVLVVMMMIMIMIVVNHII